MSDKNITKDAMYDAVAPDDFESMLELDRYGNRSTAFDKIISATHDHFWDPLDKDYIDFHPRFAAVESERDALLASAKSFRDCLLHQRWNLEGNGMTSDQINDVLNLFDTLIGDEIAKAQGNQQPAVHLLNPVGSKCSDFPQCGCVEKCALPF